MFAPKTVDSVLNALRGAIDGLDHIVVQQTDLAVRDENEIDRLTTQKNHRLYERDRAIRVRDRLSALVE